MNRILLLSIVLLLSASSAPAQTKLPPAGTVFRFSDSAPKWVTADLEFRDPSDTLWPSFVYGKPAGEGRIAFSPEGSEVNLRIECDKLVQRNGDQSRRVLGHLSESPKVALAITSLGKWTSEPIVGAGKKRTNEFVLAEGTLDVAGKRIAVKGKAKLQFRYDRKSAQFESVYLDMSFPVGSARLGIGGAPMELAVRAGVTGYVEKK